MASPLPHQVQQIVDTMIEHYQPTTGLSWMHGQGSTFSRFSDRSDLDFVAVWEADLPAARTLPELWQSTWTTHEAVALEQARHADFDVDVLHVPRRLFDLWRAGLSRGEGWAGPEWPLPVYAVAGLAHGVVLVDSAGTGTKTRSDAQTPPPGLLAAVRDRLTEISPAMLAELERCAERQDNWLHQSLSTQLHKVIYTGWFLAEGHLPPFPKRLPAWFGHLVFAPDMIRLEQACWEATSLSLATEARRALVKRVLETLAR